MIPITTWISNNFMIKAADYFVFATRSSNEKASSGVYSFVSCLVSSPTGYPV